MPPIRTSAIVLRTVDVFETSRVLTLFTREAGKVSALAKGARRLKSPFQSSLDLLSVCDIVCLSKGSEALDLLTEAKLLERFDAFRHDLSALYSGLYVAELLHDLTDRHDPHPRLFDAAVVTLRRLRDPQVRPRRVLRFELALLRELGLMPALLACVHCGQPAGLGLGLGLGEGNLEPDRSVSFGLATGGVLCPDCRAGQPHVARLSAETLGLIQALAAPGNGWRDPAWTPKTVASARATIGAVVAHQLGRRPRMTPYLERGD